jgi:hypothetical protein
MNDRNRKSRRPPGAKAQGGKARSAALEAVKNKAEKPPEEPVRQASAPAGSRVSATTIAAEAVGDRIASAIPEPVKDEAEEPPEEAARRIAMPPGFQRDAAAAAEVFDESGADAHSDTAKEKTETPSEREEGAVRQAAEPDVSQAKADAIAAEAVGEKERSATPEAAQHKAGTPPEVAVQQAAMPAGSQAGMAEITAASVGERVGDAYADTGGDQVGKPPGETVEKAAPVGSSADDLLSAGRQAARVVSRPFNEQPFLMMLLGIAVGYVAALLIHRRR